MLLTADFFASLSSSRMNCLHVNLCSTAFNYFPHFSLKTKEYFSQSIKYPVMPFSLLFPLMRLNLGSVWSNWSRFPKAMQKYQIERGGGKALMVIANRETETHVHTYVQPSRLSLNFWAYWISVCECESCVYMVIVSVRMYVSSTRTTALLLPPSEKVSQLHVCYTLISLAFFGHWKTSWELGNLFN